jgi:diacylglycerol kinase family enzyme
VRGLLVVNPRATTTSPRVIDVLVHALADEVDLDVTVTTHQGHGTVLGEHALDEGMDLVITLGGDGIVNEVVNGLLRDGPGPDVPRLATVPGGSANVFARTLGIPTDPVEATGLILGNLRADRVRTLGLGRADERWFVANAGLGIDAEIIASMERQRRSGHAATPARYLRTTLAQFFRRTDRRRPALTLTREDPPAEVDGVFLAIVQNSTPWTYLGSWPVSPCPEASFDTGLDVFAVRRMDIPTAALAARRMLARSTGGSLRDGVALWHDETAFTLTASRPVAFQIDGEGMGMTERVVFTSHAAALRVVA